MDFRPGRPHWWQWPVILSLDAPTVLVTWQGLLARAANATLAPRHIGLLFAAVWLSYSADRWVEGWRLTPGTVRTQRHAFAIRRRWPLFALWLVVLIVSVGVAVRSFSAREWTASLLILPPALAYLFSHQWVHRTHPLRLPKEIVIAGVLAGGVAAYPAALAPDRWPAIATGAALFFSLALADLLLIATWETDVDVAQEQTSLALTSARVAIGAKVLLGAIFLTGVALAGLVPALRETGSCAASSAALLALVDFIQPRIGRERARAVVDLSLLTPLLRLFR